MGYEVGHYGNRIDILCDIVDRILNGNKKLKGISDIEPAQRDFVPYIHPVINITESVSNTISLT